MLITAVSFFIISIALLSLYATPVKGYEVSLYQKTPLIVWVALIFGIFNGGLLFYRYYGSRKKLWLIGLFEILLCFIIIMSIYTLRGSIFLAKADSLSYVGYSKDIILFGSIPDYNFYPLCSLLVSSTSVITNLTVMESVMLFPAAFLIVYFISIVAWSKSISRKPGFVIAMSFASLPLFFAWFVPSIYYMTLAVLMIPIFLYSLQKGKSGDIRFISITFALFAMFTLWHPLVAIFLLLFLTIIFIIERSTKSQKVIVSSSLILFSGVIFLGWVAAQTPLVNTISFTVDQLFGLVNNSSSLIAFENSSSKLGLIATVQSVLACTLDDIIFMILSIWAAIIIWRKGWRKNPIGPYFACLIGGTIFLAALIVATSIHNPFRLVNLNLNLILAIPLVGYLLYQKQKHGKVTTARFITFLILLSIITSIFSIYQDPIQSYPNGTITISETSGANWFINLKDRNMNTSVIQTSPVRFADLIFGHIYELNHGNSFIEKDAESHFTLIMSSNKTIEGTYLIVSSFDRIAYTQVWQNANRFDDNDFQALSLSNMVDKNFDNGGFSCYIRA